MTLTAGPSGTTTLLEEARWLVRDVGEPCWLSGPTAAALHGFDGFVLRRPLHVTIPRGRNVRRIGVVVHTSTVLPPIDRETVSGLPITSPTRTLIDLAGEEPARLAAALDSALRDGLTSDDLLHRRITALRAKGRHGVPNLLAAVDGHEVTRGGHSWLEREYLRLIAGAGLPRPATQATLSKAADRLVRVDCWFRGTPVVVELLGYRFHRSKLQLARDTERLNALLTDGFAPYQFTYDQVVTVPDVVLETTEQALARHRPSSGADASAVTDPPGGA